MSDTMELVEWSLEQACPLRKEHFPMVKPILSDALASAQRIRKFPEGLFNGIYISGYGCKAARCGSAYAPYPSTGFDTDKVFADWGGLSGVEQLCGSCPANTSTGGLAGCFGSIYQPPDYEPLQQQLRSIIIRLGIEREVAREFPQIEPLWRGLWAHSPLTTARLRLLRGILAEMLAEDRCLTNVDPGQLEEFEQLIDAMDLAESQNLSMHVRLLPRGHIEDELTVFPHCPFCKALARVEHLFLSRYPDTLQTCQVCGTEFSPAATGSHHRGIEERQKLRQILSQEQFEQLALDCLIRSGETPQDASAIIVEAEAEHREREAKWKVELEDYRRSARYLHQHVYQGLTPLPHPFDGCSEAPKEHPWDTTWLSGNEMLVALHRARELGLNTRGLTHRSDFDESMDRSGHKWNADLVEVLAQWRAEGCCEKFIVHFIVPDELLYPELSPDERLARKPKAEPNPTPDIEDLLNLLHEELPPDG